MEAGTVGFIQEALRGIMKCLGLEGKVVPSGEKVVSNPLPPSPPLDPVTSMAVDDTPTNDPLVDVLSSPTDNATMITMDIDNNHGAQSNVTLVTIDEIINMTGGTTAEAHYVELLDDGQPKISLLTTSLISSSGGGKTH